MKPDMTDELDVDALLEAPFKKEDTSNKSKQNGHSSSKDSSGKSRDKDRHRARDGEKKKRSSSRSKERRKRSGSMSKERRHRSQSQSRDRRKRSRSRNRADRRSPVREKERRHQSKSRERRRSRSRDRARRGTSRSESHRRRSRSRSHKRNSPSASRRRSRSGSRRRRTRSGSRKRKSHSRTKSPPKRSSPNVTAKVKRELTVEERDARTVFCMQLSSRIRARDLEQFFSVVGRVNDVRIITDAKTHRSKGIAYVEFEDVESVPLAMGLSNQKLLGVPIIVQPTQAEKNRIASSLVGDTKGLTGPMRLYVGSLHFNITEEMLKAIFEPFGKIDLIQLIIDSETGRSKGYGFITYHNAEDAKKALEQLNGFELAGRPMKVNHVTERTETMQPNSLLDTDDMERAGIDLGATGRLQLMAKLAEGTGLELPAAAANALNMPPAQFQQPAPPIATQCFLLSNMFDPSSETKSNWAAEIRADVIDECNKHGGVLHVFVDRQSAQGNVYVKCPTIATAVASVNALHGRWFAGKMITAAYVPVMNYHSLFPDATTAGTLLTV